MKIRKRYNRGRMATERRRHGIAYQIMNRYQAFKLKLKYGRRKLTHWWRK